MVYPSDLSSLNKLYCCCLHRLAITQDHIGGRHRIQIVSKSDNEEFRAKLEMACLFLPVCGVAVLNEKQPKTFFRQKEGTGRGCLTLFLPAICQLTISLPSSFFSVCECFQGQCFYPSSFLVLSGYILRNHKTFFHRKEGITHTSQKPATNVSSTAHNKVFQAGGSSEIYQVHL